MNLVKPVINLIQDVATPHNNTLILEFLNRNDIDLNLWYCMGNENDTYKWNYDITNQHINAKIYGKRLNIKFLLYCIFHTNEKFFIVGWANINTKILHLLFFIFKKKYNHWTDMPSDDRSNLSFTKSIFRTLAYWVLRNSKSKVFAVGKTSLSSLKKLNFHNNRIINLPIFINIEENLEKYKINGQIIYDRYNFRKSDFIISCGSRLVHEKGYDILIKAIAEIPIDIRSNIKVIIIGQGESTTDLMNLIAC